MMPNNAAESLTLEPESPALAPELFPSGAKAKNSSFERFAQRRESSIEI